jgi:hypothetical protein
MDGPTKPIPSLRRICARIPVHIIFGSINDYMCVIPVGARITSHLFRPRFVQDSLTDPASGRRFASVTRLGGVGHLVRQDRAHYKETMDMMDYLQVPQEAPEALGNAIVTTLVADATTLPRNKL